jgi:hypothetical protein
MRSTTHHAFTPHTVDNDIDFNLFLKLLSQHDPSDFQCRGTGTQNER